MICDSRRWQVSLFTFFCMGNKGAKIHAYRTDNTSSILMIWFLKLLLLSKLCLIRNSKDFDASASRCIMQLGQIISEDCHLLALVNALYLSDTAWGPYRYKSPHNFSIAKSLVIASFMFLNNSMTAVLLCICLRNILKQAGKMGCSPIVWCLHLATCEAILYDTKHMEVSTISVFLKKKSRG